MGAELVDADIHGLRRLALLVDAFHTAANIRDRLALASEIRLEGAAFGLDPQSRRRLGWVVVAPKADSVVERYLRREPDSDARDHLRR